MNLVCYFHTKNDHARPPMRGLWPLSFYNFSTRQPFSVFPTTGSFFQDSFQARLKLYNKYFSYYTIFCLTRRFILFALRLVNYGLACKKKAGKTDSPKYKEHLVHNWNYGHTRQYVRTTENSFLPIYWEFFRSE